MSSSQKRQLESTGTQRPSKRLKVNKPSSPPQQELSEKVDNSSENLPEQVLLYSPSSLTPETSLFNAVHALDPTHEVFGLYFTQAREALIETGSCGSDLVWRRVLEHTTEETLRPGTPAQQTTMSGVRDKLRSWSFPSPVEREFSPKFAALVKILQTHGHDVFFRGLVFVSNHELAQVIVDLLSLTTGLPTLIRPCVLGNLEQENAILGFEQGTYNLLVLTRASEDLELPDASLIIRFNHCESLMSYAYSRSRARKTNSLLVHMLEDGDNVQRRILENTTKLDADMDLWVQAIAHGRCGSLPPRPFLDVVHQTTLDQNDGFIQDPTTNARIGMLDATSVVYRYAASAFASAADSCLVFTTSQKSGKHKCSIDLPGTPIHGVYGKKSATKAHSRQSACFEACLRLYEGGLLTPELFPIMPILFTPSSTPRPHCYQRNAPSIWKNAVAQRTQRLYPTIVFAPSDNGHKPIAIVTRVPLPPLNPITIYFSRQPTEFRCQPAEPFMVDDEGLHAFHACTVRALRAASNRLYACSLEAMAYFILPVQPNWSSDSAGADISSVVDWVAVRQSATSSWSPLCKEDFSALLSLDNDIVVQDRRDDIAGRYYVVRLRPDMNPKSKILERPGHTGPMSLLEHSRLKRANFRDLKDEAQPLIEVVKVKTTLSSHLDPSALAADNSEQPEKYVIPELCVKSPFRASTLRMMHLLPSILYRMDDMLLVKELNARHFRHELDETLLLSAITTTSANLGINYERLELFGDSVLKYFASVYVFTTNPAQKEGSLHQARTKIISNKTLFESAKTFGLPQYVQARHVTTKTWRPPNYRVQAIVQMASDKGGPRIVPPEGDSDLPDSTKNKRKHVDEDTWQTLSQKMVADVVESVLGAAYLSRGRDCALRTMKVLGLPLPLIEQWSDFARQPLKTTPQSLQPGTIRAVWDIMGVKFKQPYLLAQALTHTSVNGAQSCNYERLEFIGDAILDFMVTRYIFQRYDKISPGGLSMLRAGMVSNSTLATLCVETGLYQHLVHASPVLRQSIDAYVVALNGKKIQEYASAKEEARSPGQYWLELSPPQSKCPYPVEQYNFSSVHSQAIPDVLESVIGAIFVSDGYEFEGAQTFFDTKILPFIEKHVSLQTLASHPTPTLSRIFQLHGCTDFKIVKRRKVSPQESGTQCDVILHGTVLGSGIKPSAALAARRASVLALEALEADPLCLTRLCDCRSKQDPQPKKDSKKVTATAIVEAVAPGDERDEALDIQDVSNW